MEHIWNHWKYGLVDRTTHWEVGMPGFCLGSNSVLFCINHVYCFCYDLFKVLRDSVIYASLKYLTKSELDTEVLEQKSCDCFLFTCPLEFGLENGSHDGIWGVKANKTF